MGWKTTVRPLLRNSNNTGAIGTVLRGFFTGETHQQQVKRPILVSAIVPVKRAFLRRFSNVSFRTLVLIGVILFLPVSVAAEKESQEDIPLHHFNLSCVSCHESESADSADQQQAGYNVGKVRGDINQLCTDSSCHDFDSMLNHPVGIKPKGVIPANMPLDSHSRITCLTCHDSSEPAYDLSDTDSSRKRLLHRPTDIQFCSTCHMKMGGSALEQVHWRFSTRAHLGSINPQTALSDSSERFVGGIDTESRTCLSCHEDITVTMPADNETVRQKKARWKNMSDHPIGMDYQYTAMRKFGSYNFPLTGDQRIRLFNGRLGCGSCHSLYARMENNLVVRNERSALCRKCHNR